MNPIKLLMLSLLTIDLMAMEAHSQTISVADVQKTLLHMQEHAHVIEAAKEASDAKLAEVTKENAALKTALSDEKSRLNKTQAELAKLTDDIARLDAWGKDQQSLKNDALLAQAKAEKALNAEKFAHEKTLSRYHRLKLIAALVIGLLAALAAIQLGPILALAGPYAAAVPFIAGAAGFALIWFLL